MVKVPSLSLFPSVKKAKYSIAYIIELFLILGCHTLQGQNTTEQGQDPIKNPETIKQYNNEEIRKNLTDQGYPSTLPIISGYVSGDVSFFEIKSDTLMSIAWQLHAIMLESGADSSTLMKVFGGGDTLHAQILKKLPQIQDPYRSGVQGMADNIFVTEQNYGYTAYLFPETTEKCAEQFAMTHDEHMLLRQGIAQKEMANLFLLAYYYRLNNQTHDAGQKISPDYLSDIQAGAILMSLICEDGRINYPILAWWIWMTDRKRFGQDSYTDFLNNLMNVVATATDIPVGDLREMPEGEIMNKVRESFDDPNTHSIFRQKLLMMYSITHTEKK